jgi:predicted PurR-regulated permease PerM
MPVISDAQKWLVLISIVLCAWILYLLAPVLTPFLIAAFLAYLGDPAVDKLETIRFSRSLSVIFVFLLMSIIGLSLLLILIPLFEDQLTRLITRIPQMITWIQSELLPRLSSVSGIELSNIDLDSVKNTIASNWKDIGNVIGMVMDRVAQSGHLFLVWFGYLVLVPVVTFYLLRDWDILVAKVHELIPRHYEAVVVKLGKECDAVLAEFFRGQLLLMLAQGVLYSIGLWVAGLEFALLIGILAGLVSFVPYLGFIVGVTVASIAAFMQFHDFIHLVYVFIVFGVGQAIEGMVLSPWLVGERIGLHPVAVIFAVMAGGQLFGFFGILLALPVAAVITVLLRYFYSHYLESNFYTP